MVHLPKSGSRQDLSVTFGRHIYYCLFQSKSDHSFLFCAIDEQQPSDLSCTISHIQLLSVCCFVVPLNSSSVFPSSFCSLDWTLKTLTVFPCFLSLSHTFCDSGSSLKVRPCHTELFAFCTTSITLYVLKNIQLNYL